MALVALERDRLTYTHNSVDAPFHVGSLLLNSRTLKYKPKADATIALLHVSQIKPGPKDQSLQYACHKDQGKSKFSPEREMEVINHRERQHENIYV